MSIQLRADITQLAKIYNLTFQTKSGYSKVFFFQLKLENKQENVEGLHFSIKKSIFTEVPIKTPLSTIIGNFI